MTPLQTYLTNIERELKQGKATEHTHRPALKTLIGPIRPAHEKYNAKGMSPDLKRHRALRDHGVYL